MTDHSGSKTFHAPKRAFYALGTNRADLHCLYVAKDEADVFSDPEDVLHLFSTSRVFQFGDSEFSIVNPSYSLTLKCAPEALRGWILTLNAVVDLYVVLQQPIFLTSRSLFSHLKFLIQPLFFFHAKISAYFFTVYPSVLTGPFQQAHLVPRLQRLHLGPGIPRLRVQFLQETLSPKMHAGSHL